MTTMIDDDDNDDGDGKIQCILLELLMVGSSSGNPAIKIIITNTTVAPGSYCC